jgi:serine/threonine-protein kinase RsbW
MSAAKSNRREGSQTPARRSPKDHSHNSQPLQFTIASDYEQGRDVQARLVEEIERVGFAEQSLFAVKLALEEALINAIKHGNKLDPSKKVHVAAKIESKARRNQH